jgi:RNA polymerase sigma-70 factor, ECF subfamily
MGTHTPRLVSFLRPPGAERPIPAPLLHPEACNDRMPNITTENFFSFPPNSWRRRLTLSIGGVTILTKNGRHIAWFGFSRGPHFFSVEGDGRLVLSSVASAIARGLLELRPKRFTAVSALRGSSMKEADFANALLEQARQGDREALGRLLEAQRAALRRLAQRQLDRRIAVRLDASDIIQQTFLEAHRSFERFAGQDARQLVAWLEGILDHKVAGAIRDHALLQKRNVHQDRSLDDSHGGVASLKQELDAGLSTPSQKAIQGEQEQQLMQALSVLPDDQREAVRLRHLEGWALADIAQHLGRSSAATAGLIKRGMKALRHQLCQDD